MNDNITRNDMKYLYTCILNEATSRSELPDEIFGVPEERKYPLDTKEHVYSAVKLFNHVNKKYEEELADNINKKIKEYNITDINPGPTNRFSKYYNQPIKESSYQSFDSAGLCDYILYGGYDFLKKEYSHASCYTIKFGLPPFLNQGRVNNTIIKIGDILYNNYWKTHPDIKDEKFGPFVYYGSFYQPKLNLYRNPNQPTNIDDMVHENVPEYDKSSTVIYHYNFSNNDKNYSVLFITANNKINSVYLVKQNEPYNRSELVKLNLTSILSDSFDVDSESTVKDADKKLAIRDGGYYHNGKWIPIIESNGKFYKHVIECLILNSDGDVYLQKMPDGSYRIPGGLADNKGLDFDQVSKKCLQEARIVVNNICRTNKYYIIEQSSKDCSNNENLPILTEGQYVDIYTADFIRFNKYFKPKDAEYDDMYKYGDFYNKYYLTDIHLSALSVDVNESVTAVFEAPTDVDVDEDDVNDYSDDVEDNTSDEDESDTGDDTDEEDLDDEPNDYSDDIDSEDDISDTEDDEPDIQSDEDGEPVDDTDSNDSGEDDTSDDSSDDSGTDISDDSDDTGFDDEPNDYSDSVDGDGSGNESGTTDDGTSTDDSDDSTDSSDDSMDSNDENNTLNNNNIIKNYNLLMDFQKLHTSLEDILTNLKAASYKTSLQNAILRRVLSNVETLKDEVLSYIEYNFGSNYTQNLYYFNTYIQLLKITLEMMKKMGELSQDDK